MVGSVTEVTNPWPSQKVGFKRSCWMRSLFLQNRNTSSPILWIWVLLQHLDAFCAGYHSCYSFGYSLVGRLDLWPSSSASSSTSDQTHPSVSHLPYLERAQCSCVQLSLHFSRRSSSRPRSLNPWSPNRLPISRPLTLLAAVLFLVY